jgi:ribose-phosphate pyrophosphokinase
MKKPILFNLSPNHPIPEALSDQTGLMMGEFEIRHFPDGETFLRLDTNVDQTNVVIFCDLYQPNEKLFPLLSFAENARELGASSVCLITPYLPYMRQDKRFHTGESITSRHFAKHLSLAFDALITVDPHLHRYPALDAVYTLNGMVCTAQPVITEFLKTQTDNLLLIGPDEESEQWVAAIAQASNRPYQILLKERSGDYDVSVTEPELAQYRGYRPVLVDDIISSGRTMLATIEHLESAEMGRPLIIGVHGIFAKDAYTLLRDIADIHTCNSITHATNSLDLTPILANQLMRYLEQMS